MWFCRHWMPNEHRVISISNWSKSDEKWQQTTYTPNLYFSFNPFLNVLALLVRFDVFSCNTILWIVIFVFGVAVKIHFAVLNYRFVGSWYFSCLVWIFYFIGKLASCTHTYNQYQQQKQVDTQTTPDRFGRFLCVMLLPEVVTHWYRNDSSKTQQAVTTAHLQKRTFNSINSI